MESVFQKIGVYYFFGILLTGTITLSVGIYLGLPITVISVDSEILKVILFFLESYLIGLVLQEISSMIDRRFLKITTIAAETFLLPNNTIVTNPLELLKFQKMANHMLGKQGDDTNYEPNEQEYVYHSCILFLEATGKDRKYQEIHSNYTLSRSLMVAFPVLSVFHLFCYKGQALHYDFILLLLTFIFYSRFKNSVVYAVQTALRYYCEIKDSA